MARLKPSLRTTETYTETNFLRLSTAGEDQSEHLVTLEHFACAASDESRTGTAVTCSRARWTCLTIVDDERMSRADAIFIARSYAAENDIPVIYVG